MGEVIDATSIVGVIGTLMSTLRYNKLKGLAENLNVMFDQSVNVVEYSRHLIKYLIKW